ncbi:pitrilysin family protein [Maritimibacter sp. UBA3975]|uniref:M16 family metallopeptidase n=1 Tax=Maritimibacter sp. UBA3975 TaxID=1946833 RepID=UPI000C0A10B1|nr:pitrilysin family protein [Maritimibacter sp. UBA3975]MAM63624.1 peptidase M16 [Maritimibacter sp.]|tara:strand:- start:24882 stop:26192 length:1311 start_codon:yes stop_codon:yes gene_type:complete
MIRLALAFLLIAAVPARAQVPIQEVTSPGGISAWLVEEHSIPFVALELRFRGGTSLDLPGKRGATNLMTGLLEEGAADMDSRAFAEAKEELATSIDFDVYGDVLTVSAQFLSENMEESVDLVRASLEEPTFEEASVERVRGQVLSYIRSRVTDPDEIAGDAMAAAAYGDHPYGSFDSGTVESVTDLTRADIVTAWENAIARDRVYVSAVGDITPEELGTVIDTILSGIHEEGGEYPDEVDYAPTPGVSVTPFDTPQSVARFGQPGMEIDDPDFFAAYLVNTIMGGSNFENRLFDEVREKRGLTYGIGTWLSDSDYSEVLGGSFSSQNATMAEAIEVVQEEWRKMAEDGVTAEELAAAKKYLTGAYPLRFDGNANIANILTSMQMDDYPIDYPQTRNEKVMAVTLEEANRVAAELFQPENLRFVVVGQPEGLEPTVN